MSTITSHGPYVGLPTFEEAGLTALVAGANGISGQYMLRVLRQNPQRWIKIYALSRRPPQGFDAPNIEHIALDFLSGQDNIRKTLNEKGVRKIDHIFFFAYKESSGPDGELWAGQEQMVIDNSKMLEDFLLAMRDIPFKRIVLQTGAKNYGVHIGPVKTPCREDDPRVLTIPNFYYKQEDILRKLGPEQNFTYSVVRPSHIIGAVKGNFMNLAIALGLYFCVQKELGEPAVFPGTESKYNGLDSFSSAAINSYLEEWCALSPAGTNEAFNAANGDMPAWQRTFPDLAAFFGVSVDENQFKKPAPRPWFSESAVGSPKDPSQKGTFELRNSLQQWAKEAKVIEAWENISKREGLDREVFFQASWGFADGVISFQHQLILDMNKAKAKGFFGCVDSTADFLEVFKTAQELKFLPKTQ